VRKAIFVFKKNNKTITSWSENVIVEKRCNYLALVINQ